MQKPAKKRGRLKPSASPERFDALIRAEWERFEAATAGEHAELTKGDSAVLLLALAGNVLAVQIAGEEHRLICEGEEELSRVQYESLNNRTLESRTEALRIALWTERHRKQLAFCLDAAERFSRLYAQAKAAAE